MKITKETFDLGYAAGLFTGSYKKAQELELQQENVKTWLRLNHNLHIEMVYVYTKEWCSKIVTIRDTFDTGITSNKFDKYEDCLESALKVCLKKVNPNK